MAITKEIVEDKIEVVGEHRDIHVRTATIIKEDGVELTRSFHRKVVISVLSEQNEDGSWTHTDTDISKESAEVKGIAEVVWTDDIKAARKAAVEA